MTHETSPNRIGFLFVIICRTNKKRSFDSYDEIGHKEGIC